MQTSSPATAEQFGNVTISTEGEDLVVLRLRGVLEATEMVWMRDAHCRFAEGKPHTFMICDLSASKGATSEARKTMQQKGMTVSAITCICVGASFALRIVVDMVMRATRALGTAPKTAEILFTDTEAEARAIIERRRRERLAREIPR